MKTCFRVCTMTLAILAALWTILPGSARAAEVSAYNDTIMSCYLRLEGPLATGDDDRLESAIRQFVDSTQRRDFPSVPRVCLNSEGGSYDAALAMIDRLGGQFATAVAAGDTCAGPCALLFMAGRQGDGGTLDSQQGGRVIHPKGFLRFGEDDAPLMTPAQIAQTLAFQDDYDIPTDVITAMIDDAPLARTLYTVGQATRWQIRVAPTVAPDQLSPLATWLACNNAAAPLFPRLRFADGQRYDPDYPRRDTPAVTQSGSFPEGQMVLRVTANNRAHCRVSFYGPNEQPTGEIGTVRLTLGDPDGIELYRPVYGAAFFTHGTMVSTLARDADDIPQTVTVSAQSAADRSDDRGFCGRIENGALTWHASCNRTTRIAPSEDMTTLVSITFDIGTGALITATATGEYQRDWPQDMDPVHTFEGAATNYYGDGLPDEGDDGNEPGADEACRIVSGNRSQWCYTSFWRDPGTGDAFIFIAEDDYESGLEFDW